MSSDPSQPTQVNPTGHGPIGQAPTGPVPTGHGPTGPAPTGPVPTGHTPMGHIYTGASPPDLVRPTFRGGAAFTLGVVQCVMGMALFIQQVMFLSLFIYAIQYTAAGIWTGILVIVAGVFGCLAGRTKKDYMISTWRVLSAMSVVSCVLTLATSIIGIFSSCNDWDPRFCVDIAPSGRIVLGITMAVFSTVTGGISCASAIISHGSGESTTFQATQEGIPNPMFNFQPYATISDRPYTQQPPYQTPNPQQPGSDYSQGATGPRAPAAQSPGNDMNIPM